MKNKCQGTFSFSSFLGLWFQLKLKFVSSVDDDENNDDDDDDDNDDNNIDDKKNLK